MSVIGAASPVARQLHPRPRLCRLDRGTAHISHMATPWAGVPAPGGNPVPSGRMLMSHAAISAPLIGSPRLVASAKATPAVRPSKRQATGIEPLRVDMLDFPGAVDSPAGDGVEVLVRKRHNRRHRLQLPACRDKFGRGSAARCRPRPRSGFAELPCPRPSARACKSG